MSESSIVDFLAKLDSNNIPYVSWKNNHELSKVLIGKSDIDLFVPIHFKNSFLKMVSSEDWVCLKNKIADFPYIYHYYKVGSNGIIYHIHIYFKIVTGESWIKEYILPLEDLFIFERKYSNNKKIWVLSEKCQAYIYVLRHFLKTSSVLSRLLYWYEKESYSNEWQLCKYDITKLSNYGPIKLGNFVNKAGLREGYDLPMFWISFLFKMHIIHYNSTFGLNRYYRIKSLIVRLFNKAIYKRKKQFLSGGIIVAITGSDGCGKSTMVNYVANKLKSTISIKQLTLGKPQNIFVEKIRLMLSSLRQNTKKKDNTSINNNTTLFTAISACVLALLRLKAGLKAQRFSRRGYLVISDRWPTNKLGKMDGPKIQTNNNSSFILKQCSIFERWVYNYFPKADVCIVLVATIDSLIDRNRARIKTDKETDDEIIARYNNNSRIKPQASKVITFDNNGAQPQMGIELMNLIWKEITKTQ